MTDKNLDGSLVRLRSRVVEADGAHGQLIVTDCVFEKTGIHQRITRSLEDGGSVYQILKEMRLPNGRTLKATSYYVRDE